MGERFDFDAFDRELDHVLATEGLILDGLKQVVETNGSDWGYNECFSL